MFLTKLRWILQRKPEVARSFSVKSNLKIQPAFQQEFDELNEGFTELVQEICNLDIIQNNPELSKRYETVLNYWNYNNVKFAEHQSINLLLYYSYKQLESPDKLTPQNLKKCCILGNTIRLIENSVGIIDDIIDNSDVRFDLPTWHKKVGMKQTVLDGHFLNQATYLILLKHLHDHPQCGNIIDLFHKELFGCFMGELADINLDNIKEKDKSALYKNKLTKFTYKAITAIGGAMYLANIDNPEFHRKVEDFSNLSNQIVWMQNDYYDAFRLHNIAKKSQNDISENKFTWFYKTALELCNNKQEEIILENYGKNDEACVRKVLEVYDQLELNEICRKELNSRIENLHKTVDEDFPKELQSFLHDIIKKFIVNGFMAK